MTAPMTSLSKITAQSSEVTAPVSKASGVFFVGFLAMGFVSCAWLLLSGKVEMLPLKLTLDDALHGEVTHKVAKQLSKAALTEQAADLERGASWLLMGDTGPRVRSG